MNYNSFCFAGHGKNNKNNIYDLGATYKGYEEHKIVKEIVDIVEKYFEGKIKLHTGVNNYSNKLLVGNSYTCKSGLSVHINAGGGLGVEVFAPCKESSIKNDILLCKEISENLNLVNRGVKSRISGTGQTVSRVDGKNILNIDYYGEIQKAWSLGISLSILEIGFIDTSDILKIVNNKELVAKQIIKYLCRINNIKYVESAGAGAEEKNIYYRVIAGSFTEKENALKQKELLEKGGYKGIFLEIFEKK